MNAKKLLVGATFVGTGLVAVRALGQKLHRRCQKMCVGGKCGAQTTS